MAVVRKENKVERAKRERDGLDCLEDILRYARAGFGSIEETVETSADKIILELERRRLLPTRFGGEELVFLGVSDEHEHRTDI